jgi:CysZ protein
MIAAALSAFRDMFSPPFRRVFWKSILLTLALFAVLWIAAQVALATLLVLPYPWLETGIALLSGLGLVVALAFLIAPVTSLFAGLFLDEIAETVERTHYPADPPGRALPLAASVLTTLRFTGVVVLVNLLALPLVFLLGFGFVIFFVANGYLLGREYFELVALRFHDVGTVRRLRETHAGTVFACGLVIAAVLAVPVLNLLTPLFATAFMAHMHKRLAGREALAPV